MHGVNSHLTLRLVGVSVGGIIQGDVRMNGFPKEQASFARVSGYVEQFDVHSPQTTVREALLFSAQLRTQGETSEVITAFVDEVMDLVELTPLRDGLVGPPTHCCCQGCCQCRSLCALGRVLQCTCRRGGDRTTDTALMSIWKSAAVEACWLYLNCYLALADAIFKTGSQSRS